MKDKETLEEAAEKYCEKVWGGYKDDVVDYISFDSERDAFTFIKYYNYKN